MAKERPIIFSAEMVKAILDSRKSMTRRVIKPPPGSSTIKLIPAVCPLHWIERLPVSIDGELIGEIQGRSIKCPYGKPGDELWVRETFELTSGALKPIIIAKFETLNGRGNSDYKLIPIQDIPKKNRSMKFKKYPSIHMPRWASRITLKITDIRAERVQDINSQGVLSEGMYTKPEWEAYPGIDARLRQCFISVWDKIYDKQGLGWGENPWVWVIQFEVINAAS